MNNLTKSVNLLETNLLKLLEKFKMLETSFDDLTKEKEDLQIKVLQQEKIITDLEGKLEASKIANAIVGSKEDKHLTKLKINSLIREVDKCIAQLSD